MPRTTSCVAVAGLLAAGASALGQAQYQISYEIAGQPEVVRFENHPFSVVELIRQPSTRENQLVYGTFPLTQPEARLIDLTLHADKGSVASTELYLPIRLEYTIEDLVFSSDETRLIEVDFTIDIGRGWIRTCDGAECIGIEYLTEIRVQIEDDERIGTSKATLDGTFVPIRERTGFLEGADPSGIIELQGFVVPTNEPLTLSFDFFTSIRFPAGRQGGSAGRGTGDGFGFPHDVPIFTLPEGVRVDSVSGQIIDNEYRPCLADLDTDGELTVFDFLRYQSLFLAGDPVANLDRDPDLTIADFLAYLNAFDAGCP